MGYSKDKDVACMPVVDPGKCDGCGLCVAVCRVGALVMTGNVVAVIETEECGWCAECEAVCSAGAIKCPFDIVLED